MPQRIGPWMLLLAVAGMLATPRCSRAEEKSVAELLTTGKVHRFHLELSAKEWEKMQAVIMRRPFPGGPGGAAPAPAEKSDEAIERHKGGGFGSEFPWARAKFSDDAKTYSDVGIRYKGNASYMAASRGLKRNLKIAFAHYDEEQRYVGMKTLNLNAGAMDPSKAREALSYSIFRAASVPAPRTAFAEVTLTVPGKYDKEYLGLYTVVEQVDKTFLKDRFKNGKGLLMKPERVRGVDYLGDDWDRYKDRYHPKHEASKREARRVIDFARLVDRGSDEAFRKEVASYLDVDGFLRFLAVNSFVVNVDSFFGMGHNYYIYLNPETDRLVYMPWDLDLSLAGFPMMMGGGDQLKLSLAHPHGGENKLIDRVLAVPEYKEKYRKLIAELAGSAFAKDKLLETIDTIEKATKEPLEREKKAVEARKENGGGFGPGPGGRPFARSTDLRAFVDRRTASVAEQVADPSKGYIPPRGGFGPGGFGPGGFLAKPLLTALDTDKDGKVSKDELRAGVGKFFDDCDKEKKGKIDAKAIADGLNRLMPPPPGFGPPRGPGGPPPREGADAPKREGADSPGAKREGAEPAKREGGDSPGAKRDGPGERNPPQPPAGGPPRGPGGPRFGFGNMIAPAIVKRAEPDKDGMVSREKLLAAAEALFKEVDKQSTGKIDEKQIEAALRLLTPAPNFGPPRRPEGGDRPGPRPEDRPTPPKGEEKKP